MATPIGVLNCWGPLPFLLPNDHLCWPYLVNCCIRWSSVTRMWPSEVNVIPRGLWSWPSLSPLAMKDVFLPSLPISVMWWAPHSTTIISPSSLTATPIGLESPVIVLTTSLLVSGEGITWKSTVQSIPVMSWLAITIWWSPGTEGVNLANTLPVSCSTISHSRIWSLSSDATWKTGTGGASTGNDCSLLLRSTVIEAFLPTIGSPERCTSTE